MNDNKALTIEVGYGSAKGGDALSDGRNAAAQAVKVIKHHPISAVILFASAQYELEEALRGVHSVVGNAPVLGTTTAGEIMNRPLNGSLVLVAMASPYLTAHVGLGRDVSKGWKESVASAVSGKDMRPYFLEDKKSHWNELTRQGKSAFCLLFSPGNTRHADSMSHEILEELKRLSEGLLPIFGGSSADDWNMETNYVLLGQKAYPDAVLVAVFETSLRFGIGMSHGFIPTAKTATATRSLGHEVLELNSLPAAGKYARLLGSSLEELEGKHITLTTEKLAGTPDPYGQYNIKVASYFTPQGGVRFSQPVLEGATLTIMESDPDQMIAAGQRAIHKGILRGGIEDPALVLAFSCALRSAILKERREEEIAAMSKMLPQIPVAGFYSFGEQGLSDDWVNRHNNSVITALVMGKELTRAAQSAMENDRLIAELHKTTEERLTAAEEAAKLNKILSAISNINRLILRKKNPLNLAKAVCREITGTMIFNAAWIVLLDKRGHFFGSAQSGLDNEFPGIEGQFKAGTFPYCARKALSEKATVFIDDSSCCSSCPGAGQDFCTMAMVTPLEYDGRIYGLMNLLDPDPVIDREENLSLMEGLAGDMALAFHGIEMEEEAKAAEATLRKSEQRYRSVFENTGAATVIIEEDMTISTANSEFERLSGYTRQELEGKMKWTEFVVQEDLEAMKDYHRQRRETGLIPPESYEFRFVDRQGNVKYIMNRVALIPGTRRSVASLADVSAHKEAEEALRESEERYRTIFEHSNDGVAIVRGSKHIYVNRKFAEIFGYDSAEELLNTPLSMTVHEDDRERVMEINRKRQVGKSVPSRYDLKGVRKDGRAIFLEASVAKTSYRGEPLSLVFLRDVTERKEAEEERIRLATAIEQSAEEIIITDPEGTIEYVNPAFERLTGYTRKEALGKNIVILKSKKQNEASYKEMWDTLRRGGVWSGSLINMKKDGTLLEEEAVISPVFDNLGSIMNYVAVTRDVTEEHRLERQLQHAQKMESLGTLAGGIAHDFNNLLMGIQGNASLMLLEKDRADPDYEKLKQIEQHVESGSNLTGQLLGFARGGKYETKTTDINWLVEKSSNMFGRTKKEIVIHKKFRENLWPADIDQGQIEQALMNLYVNAWQAMPGGGEIFLETKNVILEEGYVKPYGIDPGRFVEISVTDNGVGMDESTRTRIFEPFFSTKEMGRGTGLGLASVYGIVRNHNGLIDVYSEKGKGATFIVYLPASNAEADNLPSFNAEEETKSGHETVLLVDDEEMISDVSEKLLKRLGYRVFTALSGEEAVDVYRKNLKDIHIVILDMIMPGMSGLKTYEALKEINPDVKVLLSSGYSLSDQAQEIMLRGCNGFMQKPFSIHTLSKKLRQILDEGGNHDL